VRRDNRDRIDSPFLVIIACWVGINTRVHALLRVTKDFAAYRDVDFIVAQLGVERLAR